MGAPAAVRGHHRGQPRLDAQQAHRAEEGARARTSTRPAARTGLRPNRATIVYSNLVPAGLPGRADRARRHRGVAPPHRPLRLLVRHGPALDPARREGRPARLRHGRAPRVGGRAAARRRARRIEQIRDVRGTALRAAQGRVGGARRAARYVTDGKRRGPARATRRSSQRQGRLRARCRARSSTRPTRATRGPMLQPHGDEAVYFNPPADAARHEPRWTGSTICRSRARPHPAYDASPSPRSRR